MPEEQEAPLTERKIGFTKFDAGVTFGVGSRFRERDVIVQKIAESKRRLVLSIAR